MFCKKCGYERTGNEKFCPVCGTQFPIDKGNVASFATSTGNAKHLEENAQLHFCKKCGTKQAPGQKFCPVSAALSRARKAVGISAKVWR